MKILMGVLILSSLASTYTMAHSGGLDRSGCHWDKKKHFYHCHINTK